MFSLLMSVIHTYTLCSIVIKYQSQCWMVVRCSTGSALNLPQSLWWNYSMDYSMKHTGMVRQVFSTKPIVILMPVPTSYSMNALNGLRLAMVAHLHRYIAHENSEKENKIINFSCAFGDFLLLFTLCAKLFQLKWSK